MRAEAIKPTVLQYRGMRILAALAVITLSLLSAGCEPGGILLQPAQQGEWANFHSDNHKISQDAKPAPSPEKPAEK